MPRKLKLRGAPYLANVRSDFELEQDRRKVVEDRVATWAFSAHDFTDDELLYAALVMLEHALSIPELSQWHMTEGKHSAYTLPKR
jgi:hypothetical protein